MLTNDAEYERMILRDIAEMFRGLTKQKEKKQ